MALYEKFGEFDSSAEINRKAEELFNSGDLDGLRNLACENGIPDDFTEMYIEGEIEQLCDDQVAAVGKIDMEIDEILPAPVEPDPMRDLKDRFTAELNSLRVMLDCENFSGMAQSIERLEHLRIKMAGMAASKWSED